MYKILIADDEKDIIKLLRLYLEKDDIKIYEAYDGMTAIGLLNEYEIDLAIVDIMMPKMNGFELIKKIRKTNNIPIMILSAKVEIADKIFGLELGADDYITKPFDPMEVAARVNANLRRFYNLNQIKKEYTAEIKVRDLILDINQCILFKGQTQINLTSVEYRLLKLFMESPGRVFTKEQLFESGWGSEYVVDDNTIRVCISKLRNKVGEEEIKTIRGLGYRLEK
ncbi:response regulator transcription factor [Clostridium estertheticum]|uniref:response regulator transcription factor n=1 Tax=Clostridium estertheticum TaxID=238834 RepID=UPI001C7D6C97|nr:response regulator transcription factor [Clostridium estertheticum]MBX4260438.1 response regulator transcription factor [Clostridium estertheticum]